MRLSFPIYAAIMSVILGTYTLGNPSDLCAQGTLLEINQDLEATVERLTTFKLPEEGRNPDFLALEQQVIDSVFEAKTLKDYYNNILTINRVYQRYAEDGTQVGLFERLHVKLTKRSIEVEKKKAWIRGGLVAGGAVLGVLGGYFGARWVHHQIVGHAEAWWGKILAWVTKGTALGIGIGAGACLGAYMGFLGSDLIVDEARFFIDPIVIDDEGDFGTILEDFVQEIEFGEVEFSVSRQELMARLQGLTPLKEIENEDKSGQ